MKKNKMMRLASVQLVLTLLSTSVISGTFAKYVTTNSADDSARVAKWGIVLQADGKLYGDNYGTGANSVPTTDNTVANLSVDADANAVAPGTENQKGLDFSINGQPEVRSELTVTIECQNIYLAEGDYALMVKAPTVTATSWAPDTYYTENAGVFTLSTAFADGATYYTMEDVVNLTKDYYPVVYKSTDKTDGTIDADSLNAIAADYAAKLNGAALTVVPDGNNVYTYSFTKEYAPNFNYSSLNVAGETLTWQWAIENGDGADSKKMYNGADTILANLQAGTLSDAVVVRVDTTIEAPTVHEDYNLETSFSIDITVTQVD